MYGGSEIQESCCYSDVRDEECHETQAVTRCGLVYSGGAEESHVVVILFLFYTTLSNSVNTSEVVWHESFQLRSRETGHTVTTLGESMVKQGVSQEVVQGSDIMGWSTHMCSTRRRGGSGFMSFSERKGGNWISCLDVGEVGVGGDSFVNLMVIEMDGGNGKMKYWGLGIGDIINVGVRKKGWEGV
ncbi:hypothetical protein Tco_1091089 [Tanacetum coccineum]|uniref:Uncharacterized protein n=1 Tax=Tanacetum coccineum TaxID=301880 RepID=A0ABQ5I690_9ASTR